MKVFCLLNVGKQIWAGTGDGTIYIWEILDHSFRCKPTSHFKIALILFSEFCDFIPPPSEENLLTPLRPWGHPSNSIFGMISLQTNPSTILSAHLWPIQRGPFIGTLFGVDRMMEWSASRMGSHAMFCKHFAHTTVSLSRTCHLCHRMIERSPLSSILFLSLSISFFHSFFLSFLSQFCFSPSPVSFSLCSSRFLLFPFSLFYLRIYFTFNDRTLSPFILINYFLFWVPSPH